MNREAEKFRKITMKVLAMQLNSITIMDLVAYGGAALGVIMAATQFQAGNVSLSGCLLISLLSADFFIPMRQLGSFFHVAMNGMAASDKIFRLLDLPEKKRKKQKTFPQPVLFFALICIFPTITKPFPVTGGKFCTESVWKFRKGICLDCWGERLREIHCCGDIYGEKSGIFRLCENRRQRAWGYKGSRFDEKHYVCQPSELSV